MFTNTVSRAGLRSMPMARNQAQQFHSGNTTKGSDVHKSLCKATTQIFQSANLLSNKSSSFLREASRVLPSWVGQLDSIKPNSKVELPGSGPTRIPSVHHVDIEPDTLKIEAVDGRYPTLGNGGISYLANIDGIPFSSKEVAELQSYIWKTPSKAGNQMDFLPQQPIQPLSGPLQILSDLAHSMPIELADGSAGLLDKNQLRQEVEKLDHSLIDESKALVKQFKSAQSPAAKAAIAQEIQSLSCYCQWLVRGVLYEGTLHNEPTISPVVPSPLSVVSAIANRTTGLLRDEFVYANYTKLPAVLSKELVQRFDQMDYDNPAEILQAIADIETPVGFGSLRGGSPEHNFRFNHVLMEYQMRRAFEGYGQVKEGDPAGLDKMVEAYRRAHKTFETMLTNTPPKSYPAVRLPIQAVEGKKGIQGRLPVYPGQTPKDIIVQGFKNALQGDSDGIALVVEGLKRLDQKLAKQLNTSPILQDESLFPPEGVLYEGLGEETLTDAFSGKVYYGYRPVPTPGQTGANSSMYKWGDIHALVAKLRKAYQLDASYFDNLTAVIRKEVPYTQLGKDPIDSMMLAFDVFTRPDLHQQVLVETYEEVENLELFKNPTSEHKLKLLQLSYWIAKHRLRHGQYVNKAIFSQTAKANQSRAEGTGGSSIQFLKRFFDDTLAPARELITELKAENGLSDEGQTLLQEIEKELFSQEIQMEKVDKRGRDLARQEGKPEMANLSARRV